LVTGIVVILIGPFLMDPGFKYQLRRMGARGNFTLHQHSTGVIQNAVVTRSIAWIQPDGQTLPGKTLNPLRRCAAKPSSVPVSLISISCA